MTEIQNLIAQAIQKVKEIEKRMSALAADGLLPVSANATSPKKKPSPET